jgi:hypothetical protein
MKRARIFFWLVVCKASGAVSRWAQRRGAKACGCVECRPIWDQAFRRQLVENIIARAVRDMGGAPQPAPDRRPS